MSGEAFSLHPTENMKMIQQVGRDFAEKELRPNVMKYDESQEFPFELVPRLGEMGFFGATIPEKYGGAGLSMLDFTVLIEELSKVDPSVALTLCAHSLCAGHIFTYGSEAQKKKYLPGLCSGKKIGGWGLTEPGSGSDAAGMKTTAKNNGMEWLLNGSKAFITHGSVGSIFVVMALSNQPGEKKAISAFIIEKGTPGFSSAKKENKLGMRASDTAGLLFEDTRIPKENIIGKEGDGFHQAMRMLDVGRIGIAALSVGLAQGALDVCLKYVKQRQQFGKALAEFQAIQWKLAEMATEIEAARLLTQKAAWMKINGDDFILIASQAKFFASEVAMRASNEAVQIHGGYGYTKDFPVEKFYRDAKLLTIGEGTTEVQKMVISKNLLH
jgi:alkylation response protein AidB-like acyl-CoA dehydrogenase